MIRKYFIGILLICLPLMGIAKSQSDFITKTIHYLLTPSPALNRVTLGNRHGPVTLIEFTDYNCGYCRRLNQVLNKLIVKNNDLRLVVIDYPIIANTSFMAATAAYAAAQMDKFAVYHQALMQAPKGFDRQKLMNIAKAQHLDPKKFTALLNNPDITKQVKRNVMLGQLFGLQGAPAIIMEKTESSNIKRPLAPLVANGYVSYDRLQKGLEMMRKRA